MTAPNVTELIRRIYNPTQAPANSIGTNNALFAQSHPIHQTHMQQLVNHVPQFANGNLALANTHDELRQHARDLEDALKDAQRADSDVMKKHHESSARAAKRRLQDSYRTGKADFAQAYRTNENALKSLERDQATYLRQMDQAFETESRTLQSAIDAANRNATGEVVWQSTQGPHAFAAGGGVTVEQAGEHLRNLQERHRTGVQAVESHFAELKSRHETVRENLHTLSNEVKSANGELDLMAGLGKSGASEVGSSVAQKTEEVTKAAKGQGFKKVGGTFLGGLIGAIVGHQFDSEDSKMGAIVGTAVGGGAGYLVTNRMLASAAAKAVTRA